MSSTNQAPDAPAPEGFLAVLDALVEMRQSISQMQAMEVALYAACGNYALREADGQHSRDTEISWRSTAMELGAALHLSDRTAAGRMDSALVLSEKFSTTMSAWVRGEITRDHAQVIVDAGEQIHDAQAREQYQEKILAIATEETPARTRATARVIASRIEPDLIAKRQKAALATRHVRIADLEDGLSSLTALLPTTLAHAIYDRLTQAAKLVTGADAQAARESTSPAEGEGATTLPRRRTDEVRADLLCDLLLTGSPSPEQLPPGADTSIDLGAVRGRVQIVVTADSLFSDSDALPILAGGGAIPIDQARALAAQTTTWDRLTIDPSLNMLTKVDTYRPTEAQRRYLTALDEHCRQPGCQRLAMWCDIDHSHDAAYGGATELHNLGNVCEPHHVIKHADGWTIKRTPDGAFHWKSKHGRTYPDIPRPAVAFMIEEPAPF